ncbi:MAG: hypothetical protein CVV44_03825 [Spirochaetae bacterium HGW-Spirochaetae-1]|jgi:prophage tail gpP-like protein|nr:MAG: hypothetical protein CVV44_03825 [Spirochaetae bacterium HGW-Spirochaetae-1]
MADRSAFQQTLYEDRLKFYETSPKPVSGTWYKVPKGAWLDSISMSTYGKDRIADIIQANPFLQTRPVHPRNFQPYIHPGDMIWLPPSDNKPKQPDTIPADDPEEIAIRIEGKIYRGFEALTISRNMETCADGFLFTANYDPDREESKILDPYTYYKADLFIGGEKFISGEMLKWTPEIESGSMIVEVRSLPGVTVDCQSLDMALDYNGMTLRQIAEKVLAPFGLITNFPDGDTDTFVKANRQITDTVFGFLSRLATQKGFIITSGPDSEMVFARAAVDSVPAVALVAGHYPLIAVTGASFNGSTRFSHYIAVGQSHGKPAGRSEIMDESVPVYRPTIFQADDTTPGNISDVAKWQKNRALASSIPLTAHVWGWRTPAGDLWRENTKVTLHFPRACIFTETEFLITSVNFTKDDSGGNTADLTLSLPAAFTLNDPEVIPWRR